MTRSSTRWGSKAVGFRNLPLDIDYTGRGDDILKGFVLPVLAEATEYDRVTSFFTSDSLIAIAEGLDELWNRGGRMRLVLGLHDVPEDLATAALASEDTAAELIAQVRRRIVEGLATISDELSADRLSTIAWMIKDGLLAVRVAAPQAFESGRAGLFHNKVFIFKDEDGDVVAAVGSPNETGAGLGCNFEHLTAFTSWEEGRYTDAQIGFFERLWADEHEDLAVRELDACFADEILDALGQTARRQRPVLASEPLTLHQVLEAAVRMPSLAMVGGGHSALFPHQELVFLEALSRWPVRVMLADEVGLGKTFEAGAILSYLLTHGGASRALVLAPKAVIYQWQAELSEHFGIDAWVYESSRRAYVSLGNEVRVLEPSQPIIGSRAPRVLIMSAQLARGTRKQGHVFANASVMPDVLVVDEAHSARVKPDLSGNERPTLMWRMLNDIARKIPHVVFATATPMQVHWREYHALLELLGLPAEWAKPDNYRRSLELATRQESIDLADAGLAARLIRGALQAYNPVRLDLEPQERALLEKLQDSDLDKVAEAICVRGDWHAARGLLVKTHPAHLLTLRNTRTALQEIGYSFPERNLPAYALAVPDEVRVFYRQVEDYLTEAYFEVERALFPDRKFSIGFVKCAYQQRLASSMAACRLSLRRRHERISRIEHDATSLIDLESGFDELSESDIFEHEPVFELASDLPGNANIPQALQAARIELAYLDDLIGSLDRILGSEADPKMQAVVDLLQQHLGCGDKVLVFSRFTDTLDAVLAAFLDANSPGPPAHGIYTGPSADIDFGTGLRRSSRREIRRALDDGAISIVFCSDAASEGLNLQAARVIINVDVPWNPARLEQRIGRIARLGQVSSSVDIYNLWYPQSIEAKMYTRLMERRDLYELAVGEFPDVVGATIRDQLASQYGADSADRDAIAELNALKNDVQVRSLRSLWDRNVPTQALTDRFRQELAVLASHAAEAQGADVSQDSEGFRISQDGVVVHFSVRPGRDDVISLRSPAMRWLDRTTWSHQSGLTVLANEWGPAFFALGGRVVDPTTVPGLLGALVGMSTTDVLTKTALLASSDGETITGAWLPIAGSLTIPVQLECPLPPAPSFVLDDMSVSTLGPEESITCE